MLGAFVLRQRQRRRGETRCSSSRCSASARFSAGLATQLFLACAQAAFFVYLALYLQQGRGLGPLEAGLVFTILAVAYVPCRPGARARRSASGAGRGAGGGVLPAGWGCSRSPSLRSATRLAAGAGARALLVGAGIGLCFTPLTSTVLAEVEPARAGAASGAMSTTRRSASPSASRSPASIFFGAPTTSRHAFELSLIQLAGWPRRPSARRACCLRAARRV